jgi:hypothetical protein
MKAILLVAVLFFTASAQVFNWKGQWTVFNVFPAPAETICLPRLVNIYQGQVNVDQIRVHFFFPRMAECANFKPDSFYPTSVALGKFVFYGTSGLSGVVFTFFANNNTIQMSEGYLGQSIIELGSYSTVTTNTSNYYTDIKWEGLWSYSYYKAREDAVCCLPVQPIVLRQDRVTNTVEANVYIPKDQTECPISGQVVNFNNTIVDGVMRNSQTLVFYLQNQTMLAETNGCVVIYSRVDESLDSDKEEVSSMFLDFLSTA